MNLKGYLLLTLMALSLAVTTFVVVGELGVDSDVDAPSDIEIENQLSSAPPPPPPDGNGDGPPAGSSVGDVGQIPPPP